MKRIIYYSLILIFAAVFLFSAWNLVSYFGAASESQSHYNDLANRVENAKHEEQPAVYFTSPTTAPVATTPPQGETLPPVETVPDVEVPTEPTELTEPTEPPAPIILPEYAQLYLENPDMVGWIQIEDTGVNYPVMQTPDNADFYLNHNFDKESSKWGCIYAEEKCDIFTPSDNVTIYGHHMNDGSMFTVLTRYTSRSFLEAHPYIIFNTLLERHTYEIIAVFKTTASLGSGFGYHRFVNADSEEEFNEYVQTCKQMSFYDIESTAQYGDKLITLSTCEYTLSNGRFVIVAKRINTE